MIFKVEDGILTLDREELRARKPFKKILESDRGSEGDVDGRKKYLAFKKFHYIYEVCDFHSECNMAGLNGKDLHNKALKIAELPEDFKLDEDIRNAIALYEEILLETTPSYTLLLKLIKGVRLSERVIETIITGVEKVLDLNQKALDQESDINIADLLTNISALEKQLKSLTDLSNTFPKTQKTLEDILSKVKKEESNTRMARGGREIGNRANPK